MPITPPQNLTEAWQLINSLEARIAALEHKQVPFVGGSGGGSDNVRTVDSVSQPTSILPSHGGGERAPAFDFGTLADIADQVGAIPSTNANRSAIDVGTHANRPAAATSGRLYYETDTKSLFEDNGASWDEIAAIFPTIVANGGTGDTTLTAHGVLLGEGTNAVVATAAGGSGLPLIGAGAGADPVFGGFIDCNGSTTITSNPPNGSTNVGWKLGLYDNGPSAFYDFGVANFTLVASTGQWLSLFASGTPPANNGTATVPDGNAKVSLGADGSVRGANLMLSGPAAHSVLVGEGGSTAAAGVGPGATSGIPLIAQGAGADPAFGTAVVAGGGTGATTLTAHGVLLGEGTGAVTATAALTNGQLPIGSTGADPVAANIAQGNPGIAITNSAGGISLATQTISPTSFASIAITGDTTLTTAQAQNFFLEFTGTVAAKITFPDLGQSAVYYIFNQTSQTLTFAFGAFPTKTLPTVQSAGLLISKTDSALVWWTPQVLQGNPDTVTVPSGGTGATTLTAHGVLVGEGTNAIAATAAGGSGLPLQGNGAADPTFAQIALATAISDYTAPTSWTPVLRFGGASTGTTYSIQSGLYTQIGKLVCITLHIVLTSKGTATGAATIAGLPIAANTTMDYTAPTVVTNMSGLSAGEPMLGLIAQPSSGEIGLFTEPTTAGATTAVLDTNFTANSDVRLTGFYFAA